MKLLLNLLLFVVSLALLAMPQLVLAAEDQPDFSYDISLEVPRAQREMLKDHLDLYRFRGSERMNETQLQRLVRLAPKQIAAFLATEGFYKPVIEVKLERTEQASTVNIVVDPGTPVRVSKFDIQVAGAFNDGNAESQALLEQMKADWRLHPGVVFRHDAWEAAKRSALKTLLLEGYPSASIADSRAAVDLESMSVDLLFQLESGPLFTFGNVEITGLQRYPASLVERVNPIVPGEPYSQTKLLLFQSRLQDSPYFSNADVHIKIDPVHPTNVPVQADLTENPSKKLGFGVGISTDTGERGQVEYRDLNFLDRTWSLGGVLKAERDLQSLGLDLQLPLSEQLYRDSYSSLLEKADIQGQKTEKLTLGGKRTFLRDKTETAYGMRYFLENQYIDGAANARNETLAPNFSWTLRNVDQLLYPTLGYVINFQTDAASRAILSDQDLLRGYTRLVFFYPLGKNDQLIMRGELGAVAAVSRQGIPSDLLFRTGGDKTIRGYAYQSLGVSEGTAIVGGRYLEIGSVEFVHWLTPVWGAGIFVDGGNAADSVEALTPVYGYGLGARWKSPIGPLNLDIAYGEAVRKMRLHFSVGFNF